MHRALALGIVLAMSAPVFADTETEQVPPYGYQIAAVDVGALGLFGASAYIPGVSFEWSAGLYLSTYTFGGPIVHAVHGEFDRAAASVGVRVAVPLLGLLAGDLLHQASNPGDPHVWDEFDGPPSPWWLLGGVAGFVAASVIDSTIIAGGYVRRRTTQWTPTATATRDGVALGAVRAF